MGSVKTLFTAACVVVGGDATEGAPGFSAGFFSQAQNKAIDDAKITEMRGKRNVIISVS